ncbi:DNA topoisomerase VI subunit B [Thermoproteota archaeon]
MSETFQEISPADFFYRNRDIAGFTNPSRAIYSTIRELVENSLDACEINGILPEIYVRISPEKEPISDPSIYKIRIEDNGIGLPSNVIPSAFGQVLFGSKYKLRQTRGTFGLGGKMAVLYGQITTHGQAKIISSIGDSKSYEYTLTMDIQKNRPIVIKNKTHGNKSRWHGTIVEFTTEADYSRAMTKILDYLKQTAIVVPYANLTFVDPRGRFYKFDRATTLMPKPPTETTPHPHGIDIETLKRMIDVTNSRTMKDFMKRHFQRVGESTARKFLEFADISYKRKPKNLTQEEIVKFVNAVKNYEGFLSPDATCLSPLGKELLNTGIKKELNPEFIAVHQRRAAAYSGYPFIVEVGVAYGGDVPKSNGILLYRFANRIPLLFDEASDISYKVTNDMMNWRHYRVVPDTPLAVFVHICSTKIPYKTVGKEFIADRPEVEHEVINALREVARHLSLFLSKKHHMEREKKRLDVFSKYLPKIARFSTKLAKKKKIPDVKKLMRSAARYAKEE